MSDHNRYATEPYRANAATTKTVLGATAANAFAAALMLAAPTLAAGGYASGDEYLCGDLGSLGAEITGTFGGVLLFVFVVVVSAALLKRKRVLLVAPAVLGVTFAALAWVPATVLPVRFGTCGSDFSLLLPLLVAGTGAALTYLLGRGAVARAR